MNLWTMKKWKSYYLSDAHRTGIRVRYEKNVDPEVKRAVSEFINWIKENYIFPKRLNVYLKEADRIRAMNGENVCGTFFRPADRNREPYIRACAGDYKKLLAERGKDNALACMLQTIAHEISHYYQWLNDLDLTLIGEERQATNYAKRIMYEYAETRDHP